MGHGVTSDRVQLPRQVEILLRVPIRKSLGFSIFPNNTQGANRPPPMGAYRNHEEISVDIVSEIRTHTTLSPEQERVVKYALRKALARETTTCFTEIQNAEDKDVRQVLLNRIDPKSFVFDFRGKRERSRTNTQWWAEWFPGFDTDDITLRTLYKTMPGFPPEAIHPMVRLFENPSSPIAFEGAITLERHDILHCLLGRGLIDQDEAFVLGYTMGTSKRMNRVKKWAFKTVLANYPEPYRIMGMELKAYDLGVEAGSKCGTSAIYDHPLEEYWDQPIGQVRSRLGISKSLLMEFYTREQAEIPRTPASLRLPTLSVARALRKN